MAQRCDQVKGDLKTKAREVFATAFGLQPDPRNARAVQKNRDIIVSLVEKSAMAYKVRIHQLASSLLIVHCRITRIAGVSSAVESSKI